MGENLKGLADTLTDLVSGTFADAFQDPMDSATESLQRSVEDLSNVLGEDSASEVARASKEALEFQSKVLDSDLSTKQAKEQAEVIAEKFETALDSVSSDLAMSGYSEDDQEKILEKMQSATSVIDDTMKSMAENAGISQLSFEETADILGVGGPIVDGLDAFKSGFAKVLQYATLTNAALLGFAAPLLIAAEIAYSAHSAMQDFQQETGMSRDRMRELRGSISNVAPELARMGVDFEEATAGLGAAMERFGTLENAVSQFGDGTQEELITNTAAVAKGFSVSTEKATEFRSTFLSLGEQVGTRLQAPIEKASDGALALVSRLGDAPQAVMEDIAENADALAKASGNTVENIAEAAAEAQRLGVSLSNTLEFQDSTLDNVGDQVRNLQKANFYLDGQLDTRRLISASAKSTDEAQDEILSQVQNIDFGNLNRFGREAVEQAFPGFSISELQNMQSAAETLEGVGDTTDEIASMVRSGDLSLEAAMKLGDKDDAYTEFMNQLNALRFTLSEDLAPVLYAIGNKVMPLVTDALKMMVSAVKGLKSLFDVSPYLGFGVLAGGIVGTYAALKGLGAAFAIAKSKLLAFTGVQKLLATASATSTSAMQKSTKAGKGFGLTFKKMAGAAAVILAIAGAVWILSDAAQKFAEVDTQGMINTGLALVGIVAAFGGVMAILSAVSVAAAPAAIAVGIMLGISGAIWVLSEAAQGFAEAFNAMIPVWESFVGGVSRLSEIPTGRIGLLAVELGALSIAMAAFAGSSVLAGIGSFFGGDSFVGQLERLANVAQPLETVAGSLERIAIASQQIASMSGEKVAEFSESVAPATISSSDVSGSTSRSSSSSTSLRSLLRQLLEEQKAFNKAMQEGRIAVYLDGKKVSRKLTANPGVL